MKKVIYIAIYFVLAMLFALAAMVIPSKLVSQADAACDPVECRSRPCFPGSNMCIGGVVRNWWYCYDCFIVGFSWGCYPFNPEEDRRYHSCDLLPGCCPVPPTPTPTETPPEETPTPTPTGDVTPPAGTPTPTVIVPTPTIPANLYCAEAGFNIQEWHEEGCGPDWPYVGNVRREVYSNSYPPGTDACIDFLITCGEDPYTGCNNDIDCEKAAKNAANHCGCPVQGAPDSAICSDVGLNTCRRPMIRGKITDDESPPEAPSCGGTYFTHISDDSNLEGLIAGSLGIYRVSDNQKISEDCNVYTRRGGGETRYGCYVKRDLVSSIPAMGWEAYVKLDPFTWSGKQWRTTCPAEGIRQITIYPNSYQENAILNQNFGLKGILPTTISGNLFEDKDGDFCQDVGENNAGFTGTPTVQAASQTPGVPSSNCTVTCFDQGGGQKRCSYTCTVQAPATYSLSIRNYGPYTSRECKNNPPGCLGSCTAINVSQGDQKIRNIGFTIGPWFQTKGGDIHAGKEQGDDLNDPLRAGAYLSLNQDGYPGVVSAGGFITVPFNQVSDKNWQVENQPYGLGQTYDYDYFYKKLGSPTEDSFDDPSDITAEEVYYSEDDVTIQNAWSFPSSRKATILVKGKLAIENTIRVPSDSFLAFIVKRNIEIKGTIGAVNTDPTARTPELQGVFITDGQINTNSGSDQSGKNLSAEGVFVAWGGFALERDLKDNNDTWPAEYFRYNPALLMNAPKELKKRMMTWTEVAP